MNIPKVNISEIYDSIQGEGFLTGTYTKFIRFQGCHVGCKWCDTKYSWNDKKGTKINSLELYNKIISDLKFGQYICFTGGEPLEQYSSLYWLIDKFSRSSIDMILETSGEPIDDIIKIIDLAYFDNLFISLSPKLPSAFKNFDEFKFIDTMTKWENGVEKKYMMQYKFVVSSEKDLEFLNYYYDIRRNSFNSHYYLQIEDSKVQDKEFIEKCVNFIKHHTFFKLGLQNHKFLGLK